MEAESIRYRNMLFLWLLLSVTSPGPFGLWLDGREAQAAPARESTPSTQPSSGGLSQEQVRELERQRDQVLRNTPRQPIEKSRGEFLAKEKMNLTHENAKISQAAAQATPFTQIPSTPDPCLKPQVQATAVTAPIEPLEEIILNGCGFGDQRGELRLEGNGFPGDILKLEILTWTRNVIRARVPSVKGIPLGVVANMRIVRKDLILGDPFPMPFKPTKSCELIPKNRVQMSCGGAGQCFPGQSASGVELLALQVNPLYQRTIKEASFGAWHSKGQFVNAGVDKGSVNLKNGWVVMGMDYEWDDGGPPGQKNVLVTVLKGFLPATKQFTIEMAWKSWLGGQAVYGVKLLACGPWGVPF